MVFTMLAYYEDWCRYILSFTHHYGLLAMELWVAHIGAYSVALRGRIERKYGTQFAIARSRYIGMTSSQHIAFIVAFVMISGKD